MAQLLLSRPVRQARSRPTPGNASPALGRSLVGGAVGNVLEWYDFAVFGYFAPTIGAQFFPSQDRLVSLLSAFGVFAVAYFVRPLGGALFGHIGDRWGRKRALELSVLMMAIPTFLIGVLPTYASIGAKAAVLLLLLRLLQGLSVGGELIGSISFLAEIAPAGRRGLFASLASCSSIVGIMFGSLVAVTLRASLTPADLESWGWRVPFLAGIAIGWVGLWMRRRLPETPVFEQMKQNGEVDRRPIARVLFTMPREVLLVAALVTLSGGGFYLLFVWWPTLLSQIIQPPIAHSLLVNTLSMAVLAGLIPVMGSLSDRVGRRTLLVTGAAGVAIFACPLFHLVDHRTFASALTAQLIFAVLISIFMGPVPAVIAEVFPPRLRYSGMAVGYNLSLAVLGGTAPYVATQLVSSFQTPLAPALYLAVLAFVSLAAALRL